MGKEKKKFNYKALTVVLLILLIGIPISIIYTLNQRTSNEKETAKENNDTSSVTNILLLGTDGREGETNYRSDSMMIATIDLKNKNTRLTSLARDTYVNIPGRGKGKLNSAYFWGKEDLLIKTIKENFDIPLDKYVTVDFDNLMNLVFVLGGVEVDVKEHEIDATNAIIPSSYESCTYENKGNMELLSSPGIQTLNGYQAIAYSRIRYSDNAINRDARQRAILLSVFSKMKKIPTSNYEKTLNELSPYFSTNLTSSQILDLAANAYVNGALTTLKQGQFPIIDDIHVKGGSYKDAGWVWLYDLNSVCVLKDFIYNDIDMKDNEYLKNNDNIELNY